MGDHLTDEEITRMAKARVGFKSHAAVYVMVNLLLAAIWYLTTFVVPDPQGDGATYYWPIWPHLGWGLGLSIHAFFAMGPGQHMQAREEARLRRHYNQ